MVFDSPGVKTVTLEVCNGEFCDTLERSVVVLDPRPFVLSALAGTNLAGLLPGAPIFGHVGDLLQLSGTGGGRPPLALSWEVLDGTTVIDQLAGPDAWWNTVGLDPGVYGVRLRLANFDGVAYSLPTVVTLLPNPDLSFFTLPPCRVYDSRTASAPLVAGPSGRLVQITGGDCGVPASARSVVGNLTVVSPTGSGYLSVRPGNYPPLLPTNVGFGAGQTRAGFATLPLSSDGTGGIAVSATIAAGGSTHFVVDISGYFAP